MRMQSGLMAVTAALSFVVMPPSLRAQVAEPVGIHRIHANRSSSNGTSEGESTARHYILKGALVGVVAAVVGLSLFFVQSSSEFAASPLALAPVVVGSAVLGAVIGYVWYLAGK